MKKKIRKKIKSTHRGMIENEDRIWDNEREIGGIKNAMEKVIIISIIALILSMAVLLKTCN